jgi:hypothetical protein
MMVADKTALPWHCEVDGPVTAPVKQVFGFLDDPTRLTDHMRRSTWTMGG